MTKPDQAAFWNERYANDDYLFGTAPNAFLAREVNRLTPESTVLAVADGEGIKRELSQSGVVSKSNTSW